MRLCAPRLPEEDAGHIETRHRNGKTTLHPIEPEVSMSKTERYASVWDALTETTEEAANLKVRAELMRKIASLIQESGWTQTATAERCGVSQPLINDLLRGAIARFSRDALVNIASCLGQRGSQAAKQSTAEDTRLRDTSRAF
jgi:predicted XRE-type DNA-binding protein